MAHAIEPFRLSRHQLLALGSNLIGWICQIRRCNIAVELANPGSVAIWLQQEWRSFRQEWRSFRLVGQLNHLTSETITTSSMQYRCLVSLLLASLLVSSARPQSERPLTSSIETIASGEPASIPGPEFNLLALSGLASDLDGNVYFSVQAQSRVYRLGRDGRVTAYAGNGVRGKQIDRHPLFPLRFSILMPLLPMPTGIFTLPEDRSKIFCTDFVPNTCF